MARILNKFLKAGKRTLGRIEGFDKQQKSSVGISLFLSRVFQYDCNAGAGF
jgi:hypothetical protein